MTRKLPTLLLALAAVAFTGCDDELPFGPKTFMEAIVGQHTAMLRTYVDGQLVGTPDREYIDISEDTNTSVEIYILNSEVTLRIINVELEGTLGDVRFDQYGNGSTASLTFKEEGSYLRKEIESYRISGWLKNLDIPRTEQYRPWLHGYMEISILTEGTEYLFKLDLPKDWREMY